MSILDLTAKEEISLLIQTQKFYWGKAQVKLYYRLCRKSRDWKFTSDTLDKRVLNGTRKRGRADKIAEDICNRLFIHPDYMMPED